MNTQQINQMYDVRNEVLGKIDFEKIHAYMVLNKWTYRGEEKSPTIEELKAGADELVGKCFRAYIEGAEHYSAGTGGFTAILQYGQINIHFSIERRGCCLPPRIEVTNDPTITIKEKDLTLSQRYRSGLK